MLPVERTAFWTAACRADESTRAAPLIVDAFAAQLCGEEGLRIGRELEAGGGAHDGIVIRTGVIDELLGAAVAAGHRYVLVLGCGLDARAYRFDWPPGTRFVEVDHPALIAWKEARLRASSLPVASHSLVRVDRHRLDLADLGEIERLLPTEDVPFVVVLEGVLQYFEPAHAEELLRRLAARRRARVIADFGSGSAARHFSQRIPRVVAAVGAPYRTLVDRPAAWLERLGFSVRSDVSLVEWDAKQPSPRWHVPWLKRAVFPSVRDVSRVLDAVSAATPR